MSEEQAAEEHKDYIESLSDTSVDDYMEYLRKKWPCEDVIEIDGHPVLKSTGAKT